MLPLCYFVIYSHITTFRGKTCLTRFWIASAVNCIERECLFSVSLCITRSYSCLRSRSMNKKKKKSRKTCWFVRNNVCYKKLVYCRNRLQYKRRIEQTASNYASNWEEIELFRVRHEKFFSHAWRHKKFLHTIHNW